MRFTAGLGRCSPRLRGRPAEHALHGGLEAWREDGAGTVLHPEVVRPKRMGWRKGVSAMQRRAVSESPPVSHGAAGPRSPVQCPAARGAQEKLLTR